MLEVTVTSSVALPSSPEQLELSGKRDYIA